MLVISRQQDQVIDFPECGISISFLSTSTRKVRVGIDAPPSVTVLRREVPERVAATSSEDNLNRSDVNSIVSVPINDLRFQRQLHGMSECVEASTVDQESWPVICEGTLH